MEVFILSLFFLDLLTFNCLKMFLEFNYDLILYLLFGDFI